uniref:Uncharacterized protein n=1 Tax=Medicago truncatula TaxID=3880 RepID=Q2HUW0_MEDTR|nr:hypothetical protein MtrDRAFT_AC149040g27v2 [Medicago truncatula]
MDMPPRKLPVSQRLVGQCVGQQNVSKIPHFSGQHCRRCHLKISFAISEGQLLGKPLENADTVCFCIDFAAALLTMGESIPSHSNSNTRLKKYHELCEGFPLEILLGVFPSISPSKFARSSCT